MQPCRRYRNVLVAFDGSPEAELALAHAVAMAQVYRAQARASSPSCRRRRCSPGRRRAGCAASTTPSRRSSTTALREAADGVPDDLSVTTQLLDGDPARELLRAAREGDHDVIVMGSRGRGRVTRGAARQRLQPRHARRRRAGDRDPPPARRRARPRRMIHGPRRAVEPRAAAAGAGRRAGRAAARATRCGRAGWSSGSARADARAGGGAAVGRAVRATARRSRPTRVALAERIGELLDAGERPLVLGGDCSILLGAMLALRRRGRYGLAFVDGHLDFRHRLVGRTARRGRGPGGRDRPRGGRAGRHRRAAAVRARRRRRSRYGEREPASARSRDRRSACIDLDALRARRVGACRRVPYWVHVDADVLDSALERGRLARAGRAVVRRARRAAAAAAAAARSGCR